MAIATTIALSAPQAPNSGGLLPPAPANAPGLGDGLAAVFSAILSQIADGAVGNNQPATAIPAVANDAFAPAMQAQSSGAIQTQAADALAGSDNPLAPATPVTDANALSPLSLVTPGAGDAAQSSPPALVTINKRSAVPANMNAAAAVSLLEAQAPAPKTTSSTTAEDAPRPSKPGTKIANATTTPDASLLFAPVAAPVSPVAPTVPTAPVDDSTAALAGTAPNAASQSPLPPVGDSDSDTSDDDDTPVSQMPAANGAASAATDQAAAAPSAGDFLADLKASLGQTQATPDAAPQPNVQASSAPQPPIRKAAPAPDAPSTGAKATALAPKDDANTTALTRLVASDQNGSASDGKSDASNASAQPAAAATSDATPSPSSATLSSAVADTNSAGALQQPLQATQSAPAATLHVAPQTAHAATTSDLDSLAINIAAKSLDGIKHFDIRLDPPELGRVEVRLSVDDSGKAQASLSADRPQTLQLLQNDAANLNRALKDAGLNLSDSGLSFSLRGQDRQANDGASQQQRGRSLSVRALASIDAASQVSSNAYAALAPDSAGVDIRV